MSLLHTNILNHLKIMSCTQSWMKRIHHGARSTWEWSTFSTTQKWDKDAYFVGKVMDTFRYASKLLLPKEGVIFPFVYIWCDVFQKTSNILSTTNFVAQRVKQQPDLQLTGASFLTFLLVWLSHTVAACQDISNKSLLNCSLSWKDSFKLVYLLYCH